MPDPLITVASRHQAHLERLKTSDVKEFERFLKQMQRGIRERLAGEEITEWTRGRLQQQMAAVRALLESNYREYEQVWRNQIRDLTFYEAGFEERALSQASQGVQFVLPSETQLIEAVYLAPLSVEGPDGGKLLEGFFRDTTDKDITRIENSVRMAFAQGQTTNELLQTIRGTRANGFNDGLMARNGRSAEIMTRTALQHAANQSRNQVWRDNRDILTGVRWVSTLDNRTTEICRSLDGEVFDIDKGPRPPAHPGCRSTTTAVLKEKFRALEQGRTRRARQPDGDVDYIPAQTTYYGWLKQQPAAFQDSVIGPTRGKLLRNGGLSAERFAELQLHKNFKPATLAEIKRLEPTAFEKAGMD